MSEITAKKRLISIAEYILAMALTSALLLISYAWRKVYPFGEFNICYSDMAYNIVPSICHAWDMLHGENVSNQINWAQGLGVSISGTWFGLSPMNFLWLIPERDDIINFYSWILLIELVLNAASMVFFLQRKFPKISPFWRVVFGVMYPFSSYVLLYYTNMGWVHLMVFLPLLVLSLDALFNKNKIAPYVVILALMILRDFNITMIVLLELLILSGAYIFMMFEKGERGRKILNLGIGTLGAILIGMVSVLTFLMKALPSSRVQGSFSGDSVVFDILKNMEIADYVKFLMTLGLSLPIFFVVILLRNINKDKKNIIFILLALALNIIPMFFENVNTIMHFGTYRSLPMRFGFVLTFVLITAACYCIDKGFSLKIWDVQNKYGRIGIFAAAVISSGFALSLMISDSVKFSERGCLNIQSQECIVSFAFATAAFVLGYCLIFSLGKKAVIYPFVSVVLFADMAVNGYGWIAADPMRNSGTSSAYIDGEIEISANAGLERDYINRIRNYDQTFGHMNYAPVMRRASLGNWAHVIHGELISMAGKLGYTVGDPMMMDSGGTIFSDALLHITDYVGIYPLDERIYTKIQSVETEMSARPFTFYKSKVTLPFGVSAYESINDDIFAIGNEYEVQNKVYTALSGDTEKLFEQIYPENTGISYNEENGIKGNTNEDGERQFYPDADTEILQYPIRIDGRKALYIYVDNNDIYQMNFIMKTKEGYTTDEDERMFFKYPNSDNSNMVFLGYYEDEDVELLIEKKVVAGVSSKFPGTYEELEQDVNIALMDYDKFTALCGSYGENYDTNPVIEGNVLTMTVNKVDDRDYLLLPLCYDKGWTCTVNGEKAEINCAVGSLMSVKLNEGVNNIYLSYTGLGVAEGEIISCISLAVFIVLCIAAAVRKKPFAILDNAIVQKAVSWLYIAVWGAAVLIVLVIPIGNGLITIGIFDFLRKFITLITTGTLAE